MYVHHRFRKNSGTRSSGKRGWKNTNMFSVSSHTLYYIIHSIIAFTAFQLKNMKLLHNTNGWEKTLESIFRDLSFFVHSSQQLHAIAHKFSKTFFGARDLCDPLPFQIFSSLEFVSLPIRITHCSPHLHLLPVLALSLAGVWIDRHRWRLNSPTDL